MIAEHAAQEVLVHRALQLGEELLPRFGDLYARPVVQQIAIVRRLAVGALHADMLVESLDGGHRRAQPLIPLRCERPFDVGPGIGLPVLKRLRCDLVQPLQVQIFHGQDTLLQASRGREKPLGNSLGGQGCVRL